MPSPNERRRNNIRTGIFVSVTLALVAAVIVTVSGAWQSLTRRTEGYTVVYPVSAGVANLKPGADVRAGGVKMGRVEEVRPLAAADPFEAIEVDFTLDRRVRLYSNAGVFVKAPLIGADSWLDITTVGSTVDQDGATIEGVRALSPGEKLNGSVTIGMLSTMLGAENADKTTQIMDNTLVFSELLKEMPVTYDEEIAPTIDNLRLASDDIRDLVSRLDNEQWQVWAARVDEVLTWATGLTADIDAAVQEGHGLLSDARSVVADNRDDIDATVDNVRAASGDVQALADRLGTDTIEKVDRLLATGQEGLDEALAAVETMRTDYEGWSVDLGTVLGNANLASQQLKLATIEIRRSPWKLLYRPSADELEHELLYEAARSFAVAAADLKAAGQFMNEVLEKHGDRLAQDQELLDRVTRNLIEPLEKYEEAQQRLFDVLIADSP